LTARRNPFTALPSCASGFADGCATPDLSFSCPVLGEGEFVIGDALTTDAHPEGIPVSSLVARAVALIDGRRSINDLLTSLSVELGSVPPDRLASAILPAMQILFVDGAVAISTTEGARRAARQSAAGAEAQRQKNATAAAAAAEANKQAILDANAEAAARAAAENRKTPPAG